ncbi:uncharacterized protein [Ptychodera flava]|uniref:uncharacterized protein n=1 Tax=Ptychodera flava TaxID=63121 RepID=UPI00396A3C14
MIVIGGLYCNVTIVTASVAVLLPYQTAPKLKFISSEINDMASQKDLEGHLAFIAASCRICGNRHHSTRYDCKQYIKQLRHTFHIDINNDELSIHPPSFCKNCKRTVDYNCTRATGSYMPRTVVTKWKKHPRNGECNFCYRMSRPGKKAKKAKRGRPKFIEAPAFGDTSTGLQTNNSKGDETVQTETKGAEDLLTMIQSKAGRKFKCTQELSSHRFVDDITSQELECPICKDVVDEPIQVLCTSPHTFCSPCLSQWLSVSPTCPVCRVDIDKNSIMSIPVILGNALSALPINCDNANWGCTFEMPLKDLADHVSMCQYTKIAHDHDYQKSNVPSLHSKYTPSDIQSDGSQDDNVSSQPPEMVQISAQQALSAIADSAEPIHNLVGFDAAATKIIKAKLEQTPGSRKGAAVSFKTRSKPFHMMYIPRASKDTTSVSTRTQAQRAVIVEKTRQTAAGDKDLGKQLRKELDRFGDEELTSLGLKPNVPPGAGLMLKTSLSLPWNKLRALRRWLRHWNIRMQGEQKDRDTAAQFCLPLSAHRLPFTFSVRGLDGKLSTEIRLAPLVCVENFVDTVLKRLDCLERENKLTWQHSTIPSGEIWCKVGGDKGGGSMKSVFQICNVAHPNSIDNTVIWNIYAAPDSRHNLEVAYKPNLDQVNSLEYFKWKDKKIVPYLSGDYEYLTVSYGLSGASGRYFCLWCTATKEEAKLEPATRPDIQLRSLEQIKSDHRAYIAAGSDRRNALKFHNCINHPLFDVPLNRVAIPGLHLSLGIYKRFFDLLENACAELDLKIFCDLTKETEIDEPLLKPAHFDQYVSMLHEALDLERQAESDEAKATALEKDIEQKLLDDDSDDDSDDGGLSLAAMSRASHKQEKLRAQAKSKRESAASIKEKLPRDAGYTVRGLDRALGEIHVHRQAYHGKSFIGNHVDKCCKVLILIT